MKLLVHRFEYGSSYTIGRLYIEDVFECYTLEDKVRKPGVKIPGETAIPSGEYKVIVDFSEHFQKSLPHVLDVPNFAGIRIHPGNTAADTEGCILLGKAWNGLGMVTQSRDAFSDFFAKLLKAIADKEEVVILVKDTK